MSRHDRPRFGKHQFLLMPDGNQVAKVFELWYFHTAHSPFDWTFTRYTQHSSEKNVLTLLQLSPRYIFDYVQHHLHYSCYYCCSVVIIITIIIVIIVIIYIISITIIVPVAIAIGVVTVLVLVIVIFPFLFLLLLSSSSSFVIIIDSINNRTDVT